MRFREIQIVIIMSFVIVSSVGIKRVVCMILFEFICVNGIIGYMNGEQRPGSYLTPVQDDLNLCILLEGTSASHYPFYPYRSGKVFCGNWQGKDHDWT